MRLIRPLSVVLLIAGLGVAAAQDVYIDPATGTPGGDGSAGNPWRTFAEVLAAGLVETADSTGHPVHAGAPIKAGATIHLRAGYHGDITIQNAYNSAVIRVVGDAGQVAKLGRLRVQTGGNWTFTGLSISPSHRPTYQTMTIVDVGSSSRDITVDDCAVFSIPDAAGWSAADWINVASSGMGNGAPRTVFSRNRVTNVRFGISNDGDDVLVARNTVDGFSADGMRGLGDRCTYEYNLIKNCYVSDAQGDDNHDDGFQSWSYASGTAGAGVVTDVVLRGNVIINYDDTSLPLRAEMQGIGCFDGFFDRWVVENNVVITDHWHGISFYGMRDSRVVNNTVLDVDNAAPGPAWILVTDHKTRGHSERCLVRNNLAQGGVTVTAGQVAMVADHNRTVSDPTAWFVDAPHRDVRLRAGSAAIDAGDATDAPTTDITGAARPQGAAVDLGAYEFGAGAPVNIAPVARPSAGPASGIAPLSVSLVGTTSSDADGFIAAYAWECGDGGTASGVTGSHVFTTPGTYTVRLTVTDDDGATGAATTVVTVRAPGAPPAAPGSGASAGGGGGGGCGAGGGAVAALGAVLGAVLALGRLGGQRYQKRG